MRGAALLVGAALLACAAHAAEYGRVIPEQSRITFVSRQMGVPVDGGFGRFSAQLAFDPARLEAARAQIEVDLASVDAGSEEANDALVGKDWFDAPRFPTARFVSNGVRSLGNGRFEASGTLSIHGKSLPATAPFTFRETAAGATFDGGFVLKRTAYGIGQGEWGDTDTVADAVEVKFHLVAAPTARSGQASPPAGPSTLTVEERDR